MRLSSLKPISEENLEIFFKLNLPKINDVHPESISAFTSAFASSKNDTILS